MIELADVEARLGLFAEGIAGRYFHIAPSSEFAGRRARLDPDESAVTGATLYLPAHLDYPDPAAYRVLALQQLAQLEFGTFRFRLDTLHARRPGPVPPGIEWARAALPGPRASDYERFLACFATPALASHLFGLCERVRLDALIVRAYPGIRGHLRRYHDHLLARDPARPVADLASALHGLDCVALGLDPALLALLDLHDLLRPCLPVLATLARTPGDVYQSADACIDLYCLLETAFPRRRADVPLPLPEELDGPAAWMQREARLDDWRDSLEALDRHLEALELMASDEAVAAAADGLSDGEARPEDVHLAAIQQERDVLARRVDMERAAIRDALGREQPDARSFHYDEWDYLARAYRPRWCRLFELRLTPEAGCDLADLQAVMRRHRPRVQRQMELIRPLGYQRVSRVNDGDELDFNAVIQARQDLRAGQSPDERVYSRRERVHRDVCAVFLVDLSASTDDPVDPPAPEPYPDDDDEYPNLRDPYEAATPTHPAPEPRRIIDVQREAMLVMAAALEGLGDSYGIYGFSGYGRDCVEVFVAKEPGERFSPATLAAIAGMKPRRSTRMGPAIRHGTRKLIESGSALKVLLILSDGFPQDTDYGPERGNHTYGLEDTAKALQEAQEKGVETFCLTVDRSGHDYLRQMCPDARYAVIEEIEALPEAVSKVYRALTA